MSKIQQQKTEKLVQRAFAKLLQQGRLHLPEGSFVTITEVQVNASLQTAKLYVSTFHSKNADECFAALQAELSTIRKNLGKMLAHRLRRSPRMYLLRDEREIESQSAVDSSPSARRIV